MNLIYCMYYYLLRHIENNFKQFNMYNMVLICTFLSWRYNKITFIKIRMLVSGNILNYSR